MILNNNLLTISLCLLFVVSADVVGRFPAATAGRDRTAHAGMVPQDSHTNKWPGIVATLLKDWISFWLLWGDPERNGKTGKSMKLDIDIEPLKSNPFNIWIYGDKHIIFCLLILCKESRDKAQILK